MKSLTHDDIRHKCDWFLFLLLEKKTRENFYRFLYLKNEYRTEVITSRFEKNQRKLTMSL